ncbi:MAG: hypothetical protein AAFU55_09905 [Pseudomonadota bacterium]
MRIILSFLAFLLSATAATAELRGLYNGLEAASGMRLEFSPASDTAAEGVLRDRDGAVRPFEVELLDNGGEAVIERAGQRIYALFVEEPLGLTAIFIPMAENDELMTANTEAMVFLKDGVAPPPKAARYVPPPTGPGGTIDPQAFVESYAFWPSENVGYGYEMVRGRYRTLIRLHPIVLADVLWKMCRSQSAPTGLAEALRGQGVNCQDVLAAYARIIGAGGGGGSVAAYNRYRADLDAERAALVEAIRCSIDYRRNDPECMASGKAVAKRAVSLDTVRAVLARY